MKNLRIYATITIVSALFLMGSCASKSVATVDQRFENIDIDAELKKAAGLFKQRKDLAKLQEAVKTLREARNPNQRNFEVEWKYAQYNYFLGKQTESEKEKMKAFEPGEKAAKLASRIDPKKPDGYFWYAANLGEQSKLAPLTIGVRKVDDITEAMKKVIEIDPEYQGASAFDGLARVELEKGSLLGGKADKAVEYCEKGLKYEKNNSNLRLTLAKAYLAVDRDADAREQLDAILKMDPDPGYEMEYEANLKEAKKLIETKF